MESPPEHGEPFRVIADVTRSLLSETDLARALDLVARSLSSLVAFDSLVLYEADRDLRVLRPVRVVDPDAKSIYLQVVQFGDGVAGEVAVQGEPRRVEDLGTLGGTAGRSLVSVPLVAREALRGVLDLYREGGPFDERELDLAVRFGDLAAIAMEGAQTQARLETESVIDRLTGLYNHRHFQERLADELRRSNLSQMPVSLALIDVDGFQRVNDERGHLAGDRVLAAVAALCREAARPGDPICRVGGDEFAIVLPATRAAEAAEVAEAIRARVAGRAADVAGVTVSIGVAEGPAHGREPRELMASANYALLQAKTTARGRVALYQAGEWSGVRAVPKGEAQMVRHLKLLQSVSSKLNRLQDVRHIAQTILEDLGELVEFHNCRIHLLDATGRTLYPVAFLGTLTEYEGETEELLITRMGEGITGRVAETGESIYAADANNCEFAEQIEGTPEIDESILGVPMRFDDRVIGTIVLSKLGLNQFDADDLRMLESLASSAAVAFQNARLFDEERQSAETASSLLRVSQALTRSRDPGRVLDEVVGSLADLLDLPRATGWTRQPDGSFRPRAFVGFHPSELARAADARMPAEAAPRFMYSTEEPFFLSREVIAELPEGARLSAGDAPAIVAPFTWEPDGLGVLVGWPRDAARTFSPRDFRVARGVADLASLAMGNATRFADLEEAFLQTVEVLANALEAKESPSSGLARQVAEVAVVVGTELGMDADELRIVELAAMFHDIGKSGVADGIASKPGPLSEAELMEMQRHPEIGERILAPVDFLQPVLPIIRAGHERWDGRGYPDGLAGEDIPLAARIIFVCDAFHAMTSDRSYRPALPEQEALRRLQEAAGTQFDPVVVRVFVEAHAAGKVRPHSHA
ncbi:MAG TPA: HD domain-containing phosphohydrolase [Actinomycetota bacterium]|nr:HD domain-containing phosphohydrolase [Actinomycetota bacterium]